MDGARTAAETLVGLGAEVVFTVSGNQNLPLLQELHDSGLRIVHARHESGAAYMAEAWGRLRGEPGLCVLTAGPGHTSALTAMACARAAETPMLCLSAASPRDTKNAFQVMDQNALAQQVCRFSRAVDRPSEIGVALTAAWEAAVGSVHGPAHLSIPVDVLNSENGEAGPALQGPRSGSGNPVSRADLDKLTKALADARHPTVFLRPTLGQAAYAPLVERLRQHVPAFVVESPRGLADPAWIDHRERLHDTDLLVVVGPLDFAVGFGRIGNAKPRLVQITSDEVELIDGSQHTTDGDFLILGDEEAWLESLTTTAERVLGRCDATAAGKIAFDETDGPLHPLSLCDQVEAHLRDDDFIVVDGGEFGQWTRAGLRHRSQQQLINGKLGAIGGSIPHAVGAALARPGRRVFAFVGDGAFGYYASELDTAVRENLPITVLIGNDARWSAEWHQQVELYGTTVATDLELRPYELVARGYGARGEYVDGKDGLASALDSVTVSDAGVSCLNVAIRSVPISELKLQ